MMYIDNNLTHQKWNKKSFASHDVKYNLNTHFHHFLVVNDKRT